MFLQTSDLFHQALGDLIGTSRFKVAEEHHGKPNVSGREGETHELGQLIDLTVLGQDLGVGLTERLALQSIEGELGDLLFPIDCAEG